MVEAPAVEAEVAAAGAGTEPVEWAEADDRLPRSAAIERNRTAASPAARSAAAPVRPGTDPATGAFVLR